MAQDKYFREELTFLKEQGKNFTQIYPQLARFLNGNNTDPDVERLLEGFAFLTARLREKVEDDFPEFTHSIINMLWPNYLRPVPSMSIVRFSPENNLTDGQTIASGTTLNSREVHGTACQFRTCREFKIYPMVIESVQAQHTRKASVIDIEFQLQGTMTLGDINLTDLRFFLGGDHYSSQMLYLWLNHYIESLTIDVEGVIFPLSLKALHMVGFGDDDGLLPYPKNAYAGYRILQEYLSFQDSFYFFDLQELDKALPKSITGKFTLKIAFSKTLPTDVRVTKEHLQLYCSPVVNLFEHDADPIELTGKSAEYKLIPSSQFSSHYEVFSVDAVYGWLEKDGDIQSGRARGQRREYSAFESFQHEIERANNRSANYYRVRVRDSLRKDGFDHCLSFVRGDELQAITQNEIVSVKLTCTNRLLPSELNIGEIDQPADSSPAFASFQNITIPTQTLRPVLDGSLLWTLISNLSLNYLSLLSKDALSGIFRAYDFKALVDRQAEMVGQRRLDGIENIKSNPVDKIIYGRSVRGLESTLYLGQDAFASEGELYLFGTVLSRFFALYASINSFHQLTVINTKNNEKYTWDLQIGMQPLI
ncbi:type VI secretion system baseplate subunit TssF [Vibrio algivorus]|uniref:Type VI secretion system baseplate subunit TssF n=1 Tax=Vibrio algivorus TaxID=1667024 RepID=A0A557P5I4_9VIBR|nr:type VI secretion system baseplate subunit TssF [Vibrio algivorus]TVO35869.1 type VI secretion system baseplate subunit TssF [Vibrio algivorus]